VQFANGRYPDRSIRVGSFVVGDHVHESQQSDRYVIVVCCCDSTKSGGCPNHIEPGGRCGVKSSLTSRSDDRRENPRDLSADNFTGLVQVADRDIGVAYYQWTGVQYVAGNYRS
jgi:hypothetical protein